METKITQEVAAFWPVVERAEALPTLVTGVGCAANVKVLAPADVKTILASQLQRCLNLHLSTLK